MALLPSMAGDRAAKAGATKSGRPSMEDNRAIKLSPTMADGKVAKPSRDGKGVAAPSGGVGAATPYGGLNLIGKGGIHGWCRRPGGLRLGRRCFVCSIGNQGGEQTIGT
jgi:hypothetical protein